MHPNFCGSYYFCSACKRAQRLAKSRFFDPRADVHPCWSSLYGTSHLASQTPRPEKTSVPSRLLKGWVSCLACQPVLSASRRRQHWEYRQAHHCQARDGTFPCSFATGVSTLRPFLAGFRTWPTTGLPLDGRQALSVNDKQQVGAASSLISAQLKVNF